MDADDKKLTDQENNPNSFFDDEEELFDEEPVDQFEEYEEPRGTSDSQMARSRQRFGQREFEQTGGDANYYKNKSLAHKQRVEQAREELNNPSKKDKDGNVISKTKRDIAQDRRALATAQRESFTNKLNSAKSKVYKTFHPVEGAKLTIKKKALLMLKNPYILIILIGLGLLFLVVMYVVLFGDLATKKNNSIVYGRMYNAECSSITVVESSSGNNGTYDIEEYVAGVVFAEVGGFDNSAIFEATAVAARTFVLRNHNNCTIAGNATRQAFKPTTNEKIIQAVKNTNGYVLMRNGELISTMYDALAIIGEEGDYYINSQKNQKIPKSWIHSHISNSSLEYYKKHYHGKGMSQWGALYLATEKGYTGQQILNYYYGDDVEFASIFATGSSDNYTVATSTGANNQITKPIRNILQENGSSVEKFNREMMEAIKEAGPGTRSGVVAAVSSVVGRLWEEYQLRLPYTYCGAHGCSIKSNGVNVNKMGGKYYGIDPDWGSYIGNYYYDKYGPYHYYGPDCSGFTAWAIYNGGFDIYSSSANTQGDWGPKYKLGGSFIGQPGDLVWKDGHIMMLIGVDTETQHYYIAHASGGASGVKIDKVNYTSPGSYFGSCYIVDMTSYYSRKAIVTDPNEYEQLFLAGMYR